MKVIAITSTFKLNIYSYNLYIFIFYKMKTLAIAAVALLSYTCGAIKVVDLERPSDDVNILTPVKDYDNVARDAKRQSTWKQNREHAVKKEADQNDDRER